MDLRLKFKRKTTGKDNKEDFQLFKRFGFFIVLIALQLLYFPINQFVKGGTSTLLPIDHYIKLSPIWAIPYLLSILWWVAAIGWAAWNIEFRQFTRFFACLLLTILISYIVYLVFPTYVDRPAVEGQDFLSKLVVFIYGNDRPYNVLPSGHTYTTLIISMFWIDWFPKQRIIWIPVAVIVILSTLFTKQHAVLDLIAAVILTLSCYKLSEYVIRDAAQVL